MISFRRFVDILYQPVITSLSADRLLFYTFSKYKFFIILCIHVLILFVLFLLQFLPRDATQSAVLLWQVVCPSVCP